MFWRKKQVAGSPATTGATATAGVKPSVTKVEAPPQPKVEKLPGPRQIPGLVEKHLIAKESLIKS